MKTIDASRAVGPRINRASFSLRLSTQILLALVVAVGAAAACGSTSPEQGAVTQTEASAPASDADSAGTDDHDGGAEAEDHDDHGTDHDTDEHGDHGDDHDTDDHDDHGDDHAGHGAAMDVSHLSAVPSIELAVTADPMGGWTIHAVPTNHEINPQGASGEHVDGQGHMHLYVDGEKVTRLYGEWHHLADLGPGEHTIRVELSSNDHSALAVDGTIIDASVKIDADGHVGGHGSTAEHSSDAEHDHAHDSEHSHDDATTTTTDTSDADTVLEISVAGGDTSGDTGRQEVTLGNTVAIVVSTDVGDDVHVHGYDYLASAAPGAPGVVVFVADIPGLFEVELEQSGDLLVELLVS